MPANKRAVLDVQKVLWRQFPYLTYHIVWRAMNRLQEKAYIRIHPHRLRHTAAVQLLQGGTRLDLLQQILGHRAITSTMIYARYDSQSEALEAQRTLNAADRL